MTNRTVQLKGFAYGSTPAAIAVTLNGATVYNGQVSTDIGAPADSFFNKTIEDSVTLCSFEIPLEFSGNMPMTCQVTSGTVVFADIFANYVKVRNPVYSKADLDIMVDSNTTFEQRLAMIKSKANPPISAEEETLMRTDDSQWLSIVSAHNATLEVSRSDLYSSLGNGGCRENVAIDGIVQPMPPGPTGYWWIVNEGSTMSYDLVVSPAVV